MVMVPPNLHEFWPMTMSSDPIHGLVVALDHGTGEILGETTVFPR